MKKPDEIKAASRKKSGIAEGSAHPGRFLCAIAAILLWLFALALPVYPWATNQPADFVVGQTNFTSSSAGTSVNTLYNPSGVSYDGTKLFIADHTNHRLLIYNSLPTSNGANADMVVGQANFTSGTANRGGGPQANTLKDLYYVFSDGTRLFIADSGNHRVLIYNTIPTEINANADVVVGQANFTSNSANQGGSVAANTLNFPAGVFSDGTKLYIADNNNHRVLIYNTIPTAPNAEANVVVGQPDMTTNTENTGGIGANTLRFPGGVYVDGVKLYVTDGGNNRVLIYNTIPVANNAGANVVVQQPDFVTNPENYPSSTPTAQNGKTQRSAIVSEGKLFISELYNHRITIFNTVPTSNYTAADVVLGQPNFTSNAGTTSVTGLNGNDGISVYGSILVEPDFFSNRVKIYSPPRQSAWSPAKGSTLYNSVLTLTFTTHENANCRWSVTDQAYADMTGDCTGDGTTSQRCDVAGLPEGAAILYTACQDSYNNADNAATNEHINYTVSLPSGTPPSDPGNNVSLIGKLAGGIPSKVFIDGNYAYIAASSIFSIVDVSNPANPIQVGYLDTPGGANGVYVSGNYAYVGAGSEGLRVIDISTPSAPCEVGYYDTPGSAGSVFVSGSYAYVADDTSGIRVINISNPAAPAEVGFYDTPDRAHDVYVSGNYAYVADYMGGGFIVLNITNPAAPSLTGSFNPYSDDWAVGVRVSGNYAYVANGGGAKGVLVIDISNPAAPSEVGYWDSFLSVERIELSGNYVYASNGDTVSVVDVSTPSSPAPVGSYLYLTASGVDVVGNYAYVCNGHAGFSIADISNPASPSQVGLYFTPTFSENLYVSGNYAYLPNNIYGLRVIDISTPSAPYEVGYYNTPGTAYGVYVYGNYAYVADGNNGLRVIDITTPSSPTETGYFDTGGTAWGVYVSGNYAFVADGASGLRVINITNPASPTETGFFDTAGSASGVYVDGNYAYVADGASGLRVINITNPASPAETGYFDTGGTASGVYVDGNYAYVADGASGLRVIDITVPASPTETGYFDTAGNAYRVYVAGNYAFVGDQAGGLRVIDVSTPASPAEAGYYDTPTPVARGVHVSGDYVYVTDYQGGIFIFDFLLDDNTPPTITDNQTGDDTIRTSNSGTYNVDFADSILTPNSHLDKFQARACSTNTNCGDVIDWTDAVTGLSPADSYTTDWSLPTAVWNALPEGTSYISVRVYDGALNPADQGPLFYVKKDTQPPDQSAWSPAKGSTLNNTVQTVTFTTSENANCRWSVTDQAYADMTGDCTGDGTTSQRCDVAGLPEGAAILYTACQDSYGNADNAATNEHINYTVSPPNGTPPADPWVNTSLVGKLAGGDPKDIFISGNYAYVAAESMLTIIDISTPASPVQVGYLDTLGETYDVYVSGRYAYVADGQDGLRVIDVSTPSAPGDVGIYNTSGTANGVYVSGSYAYVADDISGLQVIDVSNPASPSYVGSYDTSGSAQDVYVSGIYAYVADYGQGLRVINVSNPASPSEAGGLNTIGDVRRIRVSGNYAYLNNDSGELKVIDVSTPSSPSLTGSISPMGGAKGVYVSGNYAYVPAAWGGLRVIDVSTPASPAEAGNSETGYYMCVYISGNYAYVGDLRYGLRVIDISAPASPSLAGGYGAPGDSFGVNVVGNYAYVADGMAGLRVVDISTPSSPVGVADYNISAYANGIHVNGNYAYVAAGGSGLRVIDVSTPSSPNEVGSYDTPGDSQGVYVSGNYAYVADYDAGLRVIDITTPATPSEVGSYDTPGTAYGVYVSGNYAYVADYGSGLRIIDVTTPATPTEVGSYDTPGIATGVYVSGQYAYVGDGASGVRVIDISTPASPSEVGFYVAISGARGIVVSGNYAYVANGSMGLQVLDVSNPASPTEVGYYDTPGPANGIFVSGGYAYVAERQSGLWIIDYTGDGTAPVITNNQTGDDAWRAANTAAYNVDFSDNANLYKVQVRACATNANCGDVIDWTDAITFIGSASYTTDWSLPTAVWNALPNGTSYISVRVYDGALNETTQGPLFYVNKDIAVPTVTDSQTGDDTWRGTDPGAIYNVDFGDTGGANLNNAQYTVWSGAGMSGSELKAWTDIATGINAASYTTNWGVDFAALQNGTNYISVRAYDNAGNVSAITTDAFYIRKDTSGPGAVATVNDGTGADISHTGSTTELSANWTASTDAESGLDHYEYAIGTTAGGVDTAPWTSAGVTASVTRTGLSLTNGQVYYFTVRAYNTAGLASGATNSNGVTVATDFPSGGAMTYTDGYFTTASVPLSFSQGASPSGIAAIQLYRQEAVLTSGTCGVFGAESSLGTQNPGDTTYTDATVTSGNCYKYFLRVTDNLSHVSDFSSSNVAKIDTSGPGAVATVNDGTGADISHTGSTTELSANWTAATDAESGLDHYEYGIGTTQGGTDVTSGWISAGAATAVTRDSLSLTNGQVYYFTVRAHNTAGLASAATNSNGVTVATDFPSGGSITYTNGYFTATSVPLSFSQGASPSGIAAIQLYRQEAVLTSGTCGAFGSASALGTQNPGDTTYTDTTVTSGNCYKYSLKVTDNLGHVSDFSSSNVAKIDTSGPGTISSVNDGTGADEAWSQSLTALSANWPAATDAESGIARYWYAIGATQGGTDVSSGWIDNSTALTFTRTGLSLTNGDTYYVSIKAENSAGLESAVTTSNGITLDSTAPSTPGSVDDGGDWAESTTSLTCTWLASTDTESGVVSYDAALGASAGGSDIVAWTGVGTSLTHTFSSLSLQGGTTYFCSVRALNTAGLTSNPGSSDGIQVDLTAPALTVSSPTDGMITNQSSITVAGTTETGATVTVNGSLVVNSLGTFSTTVTLVSGSNTITIISTDAAGNFTTVTRTVTCNPGAPNLTLSNPAADLTTNQASMTVTGTTDPTATITINGVSAAVDGSGNFSRTITLTSGSNTITVIATAPSSATSQVVRTVTLDTTPPALSLSNPADGFVTNQSTITVSGTAEIGATITVNGSSVTNNSGNFSTTVSLTEGSNTITVAATDEAGNTASTSVTGTLDITAPSLTLSSPAAGIVTGQSAVTVSGTTEIGASVTVNGTTVTVTGGSFSTTVNLVEGLNTITVTATDPAGNTTTRTRSVSYSTDTPPLTLSAPMDGLLTGSSPVTVNGTTAAGAEVTVNGTVVTVAGDGTFSTSVALNEGDNTILVVVSHTDYAFDSTDEITVTLDTTSPTAIITAPASGAAASGAITVSGTAADAHFQEYTLEYGPGASPTAWRPITNGTQAVTSGTLGAWNASALNGTYTLRLTVEDQLGNDTVITVTFTVSNTGVYSGVIPPYKWELRSLPVTPNTALASIFLGADWQAYVWDESAPLDAHKRKYVAPTSLTAGNGFFIKSFEGDLNYNYSGSLTDTTQPAVRQIVSGWNLIGTPFDREYPWDGVKVKVNGTEYDLQTAFGYGYIANILFGQNETGYEQVTMYDDLEPERGYWLRAYRNAELVFDPGAGMQYGIARVAVNQDPILWKVKLSAASAIGDDIDNYLGVSQQASEGFDMLDMMEPPIIGTQVVMGFDHNDWPAQAGVYANDIRPPAEVIEWPVTVGVQGGGAESEAINLIWDGIESATGCTFELVDGINVIAMTPGGSYTVTGRKTFKVRARCGTPQVESFSVTLSAEPMSAILPGPMTAGQAAQMDVYKLEGGQFVSVDPTTLTGPTAVIIFPRAGIELQFESSGNRVEVPVTAGWNLVGNPFAGGIAFDDGHVAFKTGAQQLKLSEAGEYISDFAYVVDAGQYRKAPDDLPQILPGQSFLVYCETTGTLVLTR